MCKGRAVVIYFAKIEAVEITRLGGEFSAFDGRALLGLGALNLRATGQRHLDRGSRGGVWQILCEPGDNAARCCNVLPGAFLVAQETGPRAGGVECGALAGV